MFIPTKENLKALLDNGEAVADDVKDWVGLKLQLYKLDTELKVNGLIRKLILAVVGLIFFFFAMVSIALGLGMWLGNAFWGFLIVSGVLLLLLVVLKGYQPTFFRIKSETIEKTTERGIEIAKKQVHKLNHNNS